MRCGRGVGKRSLQHGRGVVMKEKCLPEREIATNATGKKCNQEEKPQRKFTRKKKEQPNKKHRLER